MVKFAAVRIQHTRGPHRINRHCRPLSLLTLL